MTIFGEIIGVIIIGLTGCFGFTTKVPDTEDISEISISVPFEDLNTNSFNHYFDEFYAFSSIYLTDSEDFEIIKNIHKSAVKTKDINETFIECYIEYTLKNGDTITRYYYDLSEETVNEYMKLWETKAVKDLDKICDKFVAGENFAWVTQPGGHGFDIWYPGFEAFAKIIFK